MNTLQPTLFIGIGHRGRQVLHNLKRHVLSSHGELPVLRWLVLDLQATTPPPGSDDPNTLDAGETYWIPWPEPGAPCTSRAESQQAFQACADQLAELIRQTLPALTSYQAIAAAQEAGFRVADTLQIALYIVADLGDPVGGSLPGHVARLLGQICRQQGREPRCAGLLFLPDATQADPAAEANTYAALKELDAHLADPSLRRNGHSDFPSAHETPPIFDRGCYLLDTINEQAYTIPLPALIEQAAWWLYSMSILALYQTVDSALDERLAQRSIRRKIRAYGSFGLAGYTLPTGDLRDWCAARLGQTIIRQSLLRQSDEPLPAGATEDFILRAGLRAPDLTTLLRASVVAAVSEGAVQHLRTGRLQELDDRLRGALRHVREIDLPLMQQQLRHQMTAQSRQVGDSLAQKLLALMRQAPTDAIALARRFLERLDAEIASQAEELTQREKQYNAQRHQIIAQTSQLSYQLKTVLMSLPSRPVLALAALGGLLLPLIYWLAVLLTVVETQNSETIWLACSLLFGGAGLVVVHHLWQARRQSREQRAAYIEHLHARAELELTPLVAHAAAELYQQLRAAIVQLTDNLSRLANCLTEVAENMVALEQQAAATLIDQARPGPWQSLLTPPIAEHVYRLGAERLSDHLPAAVEALGSPHDWAARPPNVLTAHILDYALDHFRNVRLLSIQEILDQQSLTSEDLSQWLAGLLHRAAPQCAFDADALSRSRAPSQIAHVLILDQPLDAQLAPLFTALSPHAQTLDTGNAQTIVVVFMRWGLPAFALRRLNQYWAAYANALRQNDASIHASSKDLLLPEPIPAPTSLPDRAALFAVALGLGLIHCDATGPFRLKDASGQPVSLGNRKETAVVLLGQWPGGARTLHRAVRDAVANLGQSAVADWLQHYLRSAIDLAAWEREAIYQFIANLK